MGPLEALDAFLDSLDPGVVTGEKATELAALLADCWHLLEEANDHGMSGEKLHRRMEKARWDPPLIKFEIERHGATVRGSSRADVYEYEIDVDSRFDLQI